MPAHQDNAPFHRYDFRGRDVPEQHRKYVSSPLYGIALYNPLQMMNIILPQLRNV